MGSKRVMGSAPAAPKLVREINPNMGTPSVPTVPTATPAVADQPISVAATDLVQIALTKTEAAHIITTLLQVFFDPPANFGPQLTFPAGRLTKVVPAVPQA